MLRIQANDLPLHDGSYVLMPFAKIAVRDSWNFMLRKPDVMLDAIESVPLGIPAPSGVGYAVGAEGFIEHYYNRIKNYFSPPSSGYDPNDKSVPK